MKNTRKDNCYLDNIIKSIDRNLIMIEEHRDVDKIGMLRYVIGRCWKEIDKIKDEKARVA